MAGDPHRRALIAAVAQNVERALFWLRSAWSDVVVVVGVAESDDGFVKEATGATPRAQRRVVEETFIVSEVYCNEQLYEEKNVIIESTREMLNKDENAIGYYFIIA
jgi:hypothetical protein